MTRPNTVPRPGLGPHTDGGRAVGGVLLAAGMGTRFEGGNKLLAAVDGIPLVRRSARTLLDSNVAEVVIVTGHEAGAVRDALADLDVAFRHNPAYADGQSTSVRAGAAAARERGWDAAVFALGDMPAVDPDSVDALLSAYDAGAGTILAAAHDGRRGNPVLFNAAHFDALADVDGDRGGRDLVETHDDAALVETSDPGVLRDVDDETDLEALDDV